MKKRLLALLALLPLTALADNWSPNLTLTALWNSNTTNANLRTDRIGTLLTSADLIANQRYGLGRDDSLHPGFHLGAEWSPRFSALTTVAPGVRLEWQHKFGLGALAPVFSAEAAADYVAARETGRRGTSYGITFAARKRLTDTLRVALTQEFSQLDARDAVYDRSVAQTTAEIGYDYTDVARFTLAAFWRNGEIVSYATPPRPDLAGIAAVRREVDTFGYPMTAYSMKARTRGGRLGLIRAINESAAVVMTYEYRDTEHDVLRYINHLVSVALVRQF